MRKKNLILLTSITGLLLTLTPSQALAQESTTPTTSQSQTDNDKKDNKIKLASEDKCHWNNEIPVPENKYLKLLYDSAIKEVDYIDTDNLSDPLQKAVNEGKISEKEAHYRMELLEELEYKRKFSNALHWYGQHPLNKEDIKELVDRTYDNSENSDDLVKEIIDSYSFKDFIDYSHEYLSPKYHTLTVDKELRDKYQKEFDELDKIIDYDENTRGLWDDPDNFKVNKLSDKYSSEEEQINRFISLHYWLLFFEDEDSYNKHEGEDHTGYITNYTSFLPGDFFKLYEDIKEKGLYDNDKFYSDIEKYVSDHSENDSYTYGPLSDALEQYDINFRQSRSAKAPFFIFEEIKTIIFNPDLELPHYVTCDDDETPGEDTNNPTSPETPGDKETTTPTTKTTSKQDKPSNKTSTKSNDKSTITTTPNNENREDISTSTIPESTTPNQVKTPGKVNTPNIPINSGQSFTPVNNTKPGTFNGGVSSSVEGEEISEGSTVDTGSPTTSILNKIRTIF